MKKWIKGLDLSQGLQFSFGLSTLLCLFVGCIGLFTWQQQRSEINVALVENFPKVQAAFQAEEHINLLDNSFIRLENAGNTAEKIDGYNQAKLRLSELNKLINELKDQLDDNLGGILLEQGQVLEKLSSNISDSLVLKEAFNQVLAKINWLDAELDQEFTALLQEIHWQQFTLVKNLAKDSTNNEQLNLLNRLQQELILVNDLTQSHIQLIQEIKKPIEIKDLQNKGHFEQQLNHLAWLINQRIEQLHSHSSSHTIKQIIDELLAIGLNKEQLPTLLSRYQQLQQEKLLLIDNKQRIFDDFREKIRVQIGDSKKQIHLLHQIVEQSTKFNGVVILISLLLAVLLLISVNYFYIRLRLLKRFELLNRAVVRLSRGEEKVKIDVYGNDELGRIARLLRLFLFEIQHKQTELSKRNQVLVDEINYRIKVQNELIETQQELTQAEKFAVVGQTLTSISHEITQPLNAMNAYIFSAKRALKKQDEISVSNYLDKITLLVEKMALIIKRLRQFSKQGEVELRSVNLKESFNNAWELLESKHQHRNAELILPQHLPFILGEAILIEQILVNIFLNALEAIEDKSPRITIEVYSQNSEEICLLVADNGKGWPLSNNLLQPFSSSKSLNLGLGLYISQSIIQRCKGELSIASTLEGSALIILKFKVTKDV